MFKRFIKRVFKRLEKRNYFLKKSNTRGGLWIILITICIPINFFLALFLWLLAGWFGSKRDKATPTIASSLQTSAIGSTEQVSPVPEVKQQKTELFTFRVAGISDNKIQRVIKHNLVEEYLESNEAYDGMTNKEILENYADEVYQVDISGDYEITLVPEPENEYNTKAIRIEHEGVGKIGYVPDRKLSKVHEILARSNFLLEWRLVGGKSERSRI